MDFEIEGNCEKAKNWRQSIRCKGWTLRELIQVFCGQKASAVSGAMVDEKFLLCDRQLPIFWGNGNRFKALSV
jgi:hypothetical protein